jgi:hypothetical protein
MISREQAVDRTNGALTKLYQALASLYERKDQYGSKGVQIMGEAVVAEILKLRKEIDDLIGLTDYVNEFGVPPTDEQIDAMASSGPPAVAGATTSDPHPAAT